MNVSHNVNNGYVKKFPTGRENVTLSAVFSGRDNEKQSAWGERSEQMDVSEYGHPVQSKRGNRGGLSTVAQSSLGK